MQWAGTQGDLEGPSTTQLERSDRKDLSNSRGWYSKPREGGWHYEDGVLDCSEELTSSKARRVTWPWARVLKKSDISRGSSVSVESFLRKPNCKMQWIH